ncbi:MAG TPA: hypothetical protein PKB11_15125 [Desulfovibrio sp.]|jgi:hypothetical protein|uniref:hypothetical protein n=1 Tax=Desulfovibrio TaxID=872 RepID=UPI00041D73A1|nr:MULTISPECIES: hypothetical protein [Desulfovibrio]MDY0304818.1 hypothetical protein [Desulfovibrionaceae bacterium]HMM40089.1 hypothetical protein [Desulfovibrio sp.]
MESIPVGALIVSRRPLREIQGYYLGQGRVVLRAKGPARVTSLNSFAGGHQVCVLEHPDRVLTAREIVRRALDLPEEGYHPRTYGRVKQDDRIISPAVTASTGSGVKPTSPPEVVPM